MILDLLYRALTSILNALMRIGRRRRQGDPVRRVVDVAFEAFFPLYNWCYRARTRRGERLLAGLARTIRRDTTR